MRALIIGGGVAGPVAAMALCRRSASTQPSTRLIPSARTALAPRWAMSTNGLAALQILDAHRAAVADAGFPCLEA